MIDGIVKGIASLGQSAASIIDKTVTSPGERATAKNEFAQVMTAFSSDMQQQVTDRHAADMASDSWLSKNIRPLTLLFLLVIVSIMALFHGNIGTFTIDLAYIDLYKSMLLLVFGFYFGSRGAEKIIDSIGKYQIKTKRQMNLEAKAELERAKQGR